MSDDVKAFELRAKLEKARKDASDPTLIPGDFVFYNGKYARVLDIKDYAPGHHNHSPIRNDYSAREVITDGGGSRWRGYKNRAQYVLTTGGWPGEGSTVTHRIKGNQPPTYTGPNTTGCGITGSLSIHHMQSGRFYDITCKRGGCQE